ncbi:DNA polymerase III delta subunit [Azomonas agilis]|uniref:DNA polymerase III subunit delta n=1 Tax=Azomonas agilis TaxID=116849 RepID=A0A562I1I4_9GAMM|nr:DNA polymerase III subunit delta [Azomonas agilis]TWH64564.1 DNA polymerase III delta subunit [Azomonas agilis]
MKLSSAQLERHLKDALAPVYVISGDDPLLTQEAADSIRQAARQQGFDERQVFYADAQFDWSLLLEAGASLSLFTQRRLLELRLPSTKPGDKGAAVLLDYLRHLNPDNLLLISLPRLDGATQKTKWAKALLESPEVQFISLWPIEAAQLPRWLGQRLSRAGLSATPEALALIAERVEGNLLAAAQEVDKLALLAKQGRIDAALVQSCVGDSARYTLFDLLDSLLAGRAAHALQSLRGLRAEGTEAPILLWGISRELRLLTQLAYQQHQGIPLDQALAQIRPPIWDKRRPLIQKALERTPREYWNLWLREAQYIDASIKGQIDSDPWMGLERLVLTMAGQILRLPSELK